VQRQPDETADVKASTPEEKTELKTEETPEKIEKSSWKSKLWSGLKSLGSFLIGNSLGHPNLIERLGARGKQFIEVANTVYGALKFFKLVDATPIVGLVTGSLGVINSVHTLATSTESYLLASLERYANNKAVSSVGNFVAKCKNALIIEIVVRHKMLRGISQMINSLASLAMGISFVVGAITFGISALVGMLVKAVTYIASKLILEVGARKSVQKQIKERPIQLDDQETEALDDFTKDQIGLPYSELASKKGFFARKFDTLKKSATAKKDAFMNLIGMGKSDENAEPVPST
jgi:hypothetical protein